MRKSTIAGIPVLLFGLIALVRPILGPTLVSSALEREGVVVTSHWCRGDDFLTVPTFDGPKVQRVRHEGELSYCVSGPDCGESHVEVMVFPDGNGLFYQCRARSVIGVLTDQERRGLWQGGLFSLLGLLVVAGPFLRDRLSRRRWAAVERRERMGELL